MKIPRDTGLTDYRVIVTDSKWIFFGSASMSLQKHPDFNILYPFLGDFILLLSSSGSLGRQVMLAKAQSKAEKSLLEE